MKNLKQTLVNNAKDPLTTGLGCVIILSAVGTYIAGKISDIVFTELIALGMGLVVSPSPLKK